MYDLQLIKSRITCVDVAQRCGLPITRSGDRCISPLRPGASNPSSFSVDDEFWYDFGDGRGGDCIDLYAELSCNGDRGQAIRELAALTGVSYTGDTSSYTEWREYTENLNSRTAFYHSQLTEGDRSYLHSRGITDDAINRLMIGRVTDGPLRGRLFLPYFSGNPDNGGYVCYYATRSMPDSAFPENKYMKQRKDDHCQHVPWGLHTLNRPGKTLVIAEGYFDAASFEASGYPVISAITGHFSRSQIPTVLSIARKFDRVFIVYDNDPRSHAGDRFTERMASLLTKNRIPFVVGTVPPPYHDISEYYAAGGDLSRVIETANDGIFYIASSYKDFDDLERFILTVARHTKRTKLDELLSKLRQSQRWNNDALTSLFKAATTAPPETIVCDEIMKSHQLMYITSVGFYEYVNGVWKRQPDGVIKTYAHQTYGEFSTANRVDAICRLLKTIALRSVTFDRAPVWNFINGTLELDTGTFRDHNPNDYCSFQASYPYNPDVTHDAWDSFIDDITAGDAVAAELLQFIPGYVLYPDARFQKIFILSGSGGNGKSVYLELLRQLFSVSENSVTYLQPRDLLDRFQVINFRESIVNIAGEIRSDLRDVEERMKSIASGEPLSACYKGEQFVTFVPRTKLLFATNNQLASNDTSEGLARRLILIDFKMSFKDDPDPNNPYERPKDVNIVEKLRSELDSGGIFNWAYKGYQDLKAIGSFSETQDQERLITDFKMESNPVMVFFNEYVMDEQPQQIERKQLYTEYVYWCEDNGFYACSSLKFHREFQKVSHSHYESYEKSERVDGKPRKRRYYRHIPDYTTTT